MTRGEIERLIERSYRARREEDIDAALACFTEDATYRISVNERLDPYCRTVCGRDALRQVFTDLFGIWDWRKVHVGETVIDETANPARAAVHLTGRLRHAPSGREFDFELLDLLTIRDGKIAGFVEFFDTDMLAQFAAPPMVQTATA